MANHNSRTSISLRLFLVSGAVSLGLTSCKTLEKPRRAVAYEQYEKIPILPTSRVYRTLLKVTPIIGRETFYGRYGGFGNKGGEPIDPLDNLFRKHDIVYYEANDYLDLVAADQALLNEMQKLDPTTLQDRGQKYRRRAINYFESPGTLFLTKPVTSGVPRPLRQSAFPTRESIEAFFTDPGREFP